MTGIESNETIKEAYSLSEYIDEKIKALEQRSERVMNDKNGCIYGERSLENKQLIDELSKMPPMIIATAYLYSISHTLYGEDVTERWATAVQNTRALEKAYREGYYDALQRLAETEKMKK